MFPIKFCNKFASVFHSHCCSLDLTYLSQMDLPTLISRMSLFPILGVLGDIFFICFPIFFNILLANSGDPDQTLLFAASGLGLH